MKGHAPAASRNAAPIAAILDGELPKRGTVLEIASGTGEHAIFFARRFQKLTWQPSDADAKALSSIAAWRAEADLPNLRAPLQLDVRAPWPDVATDAVVCINMIHISPASATAALFAGAGGLLPRGAPVILYGPVIEPDVPLAESNHAFDQSLRARNAEWGLRERSAIDAAAARYGFARAGRHAMPANNVTLVYRRI